MQAIEKRAISSRSTLTLGSNHHFSSTVLSQCWFTPIHLAHISGYILEKPRTSNGSQKLHHLRSLVFCSWRQERETCAQFWRRKHSWEVLDCVTSIGPLRTRQSHSFIKTTQPLKPTRFLKKPWSYIYMNDTRKIFKNWWQTNSLINAKFDNGWVPSKPRHVKPYMQMLNIWLCHLSSSQELEKPLHPKDTSMYPMCDRKYVCIYMVNKNILEFLVH